MAIVHSGKTTYGVGLSAWKDLVLYVDSNNTDSFSGNSTDTTWYDISSSGQKKNGTLNGAYYSGDGAAPVSFTLLNNSGTNDIDWKAIIFAENKFVAVADGAQESGMTDRRVMYSSTGDDNDWTEIDAEQSNWNAITHTGTTFWARAFFPYGIGDSEKGLMYSSDGINWTQIDDPYTGSSQPTWVKNGLAAGTSTESPGGMRIVSVSNDGYLMYSTIGDSTGSWTGYNHGYAADSEWVGITYGNGKWVAVADGSIDGNDRYIMYSTEGGGSSGWSALDTTGTGITARNWKAIAHGGGYFVVAGFVDKIMYCSDTDVTSWTEINAPKEGVYTINILSLRYYNNYFVGISYDNDKIIWAHKDDITTWTKVDLPTEQKWEDIAYGNGQWVAISSTGGYRIAVSNKTEGVNCFNFVPGGATYDGDWIDFGTSTNWQPGAGEFTMEVWVNAKSLESSDENGIIGVWPSGKPSLKVAYGGDTDDSWCLVADEGVLKFYTTNTVTPTPDVTLSATGSTTLSTNTWYHLCVTRVSNTVTIYVNGEPDGSGTDSNTINSPSNPLLIGKIGEYVYNSSTACYWDGKMDLVRYYKTGLTPAEVRENFATQRERFGV